MSLSKTSARKILATARAHLVNHVSRDDRVAAALKTARASIIKFDPKRFASIRAFSAREQRLQRQAAAARQRRVKRTLTSARHTLQRIAHIEPASHTMENARVAPEGGAMESLADRFETLRAAVPRAMGELIGDAQLEWAARE